MNIRVRLNTFPGSSEVAMNLARELTRKGLAKIVSLIIWDNTVEIDFGETNEALVKIVDSEASTLVSMNPLLGKKISWGEIKNVWSRGSESKGQFVLIEVFLKN